MSLSQRVQLRSLKVHYQVERSNGGKITQHHFHDDRIANCFPTQGKRTQRKMASLANLIKKS